MVLLLGRSPKKDQAMPKYSWLTEPDSHGDKHKGYDYRGGAPLYVVEVSCRDGWLPHTHNGSYAEVLISQQTLEYKRGFPARIRALLPLLLFLTALPTAASHAQNCPHDFTGYGCQVSAVLDRYTRWEQKYFYVRDRCHEGSDVACEIADQLAYEATNARKEIGD